MAAAQDTIDLTRTLEARLTAARAGYLDELAAANIPADIDNLSDNLEHTPMFTGTIRYVDAARPDDTGDGLDPHTAKKTIGAAIAASSAGDAITVKAGTYAENSLDMNLDGLELWAEIGAIIAPPGTSTCLVVSGDSCRARGLIVIKAGQIGVQITGTDCIIEDCHAQDCTVAFDIDGVHTKLIRCHDIDATTTGFDISTAKNVITDCTTIAMGGASRGFYLSNGGADQNIFINCISTGNGTAGYEIVAGCIYNTFKDCASGGGDGARVDIDELSVWSNFTFDDFIEKELTISVGGGGGTVSYNLFQITGVVKIISIEGIVETALTGTNTNCYLEVYSTNGTDNISKATTLTLGAAPVGSYIGRLNRDDKVLVYLSSAGPFMADEVDSKAEGFRLGEDRTGGAHVATYLRFTHTAAAAATGEIHWYVHWEPVSDDGFLAVV